MTAAAYDGTGVGRCWPILTGERGHYELVAGEIQTVHHDNGRFCEPGGMLTEQVWDGPDCRMKDETRLSDGRSDAALLVARGVPCLVRSRHDGVCFHRVDPAYQRYVGNPTPNRFEIWTLRHPIVVSRGKILRVILAEEASITWSADNWQRTNESQTMHQEELNLWFADFPTVRVADRISTSAFTFFWKRDERWEGRNWPVKLL